MPAEASAASYAQRSNVMGLLQAMIETLLLEKPSEPCGHLVQWLGMSRPAELHYAATSMANSSVPPVTDMTLPNNGTDNPKKTSDTNDVAPLSLPGTQPEPSPSTDTQELEQLPAEDAAQGSPTDADA